MRNFRSATYRLCEDLAVSIEEAGPEYVAASYDTGQYGHGPSPEDAIEDLCRTLEGYYELLVEEEPNLGRQPAQHLRYLRSILERLDE